MVEIDVEDGLGFPLRGEDALAVHALGGGLPVVLNVVLGIVTFVGLLFPPLLLLAIPLGLVSLLAGVFWVGYFLRVARTAFAGGSELPGLGDWGALARDGLVGSLVAVAYQVPTVVLIGLSYVLIFGWALGVEAMQGSPSGSGVAALGVLGFVVLMVLFLLGMLWAAVAAYLAPITLLAYADEGDLGAALSWTTLKRLGTDGDYAVGWIVSVGGAFAVWSLVSMLASVLVGYLLLPLLPLVFFYLGVAGFYMTGQAYAMEFDVGGPGAAADDADPSAGGAEPAGTPEPPETQDAAGARDASDG